MTTPSILDSRISWTRLALSLALSLVGNAGMWAIIVILPAVEAEFGTGRAAATLPYTLTMIGFALGNWVIGRWVDRFGAAKVLAAAALIMAASFGGAAMAPNVAVLSAIQMAIGFATAASFGPLIADVSQWFLKRRGIAVAIIASGNYLSGAFWPAMIR
jgi:MFS family permease